MSQQQSPSRGDDTSGSLRSAQVIVPMVMEMVDPGSVIDLGCRKGEWLSVFKEQGVERVVGVEVRRADPGTLRVPEDCLLVHDLSTPLSLEERFDLVVSLEVAEHLPPEAADTFVDTLVGLGPVVLFSAAIPLQGGIEHRNERWPEYWAERFAERGHVVVDCVRERIWLNEEVEFWYAQNTLVFVEEGSLDRYPPLEEAYGTTRPTQLSLVHPRHYLARASTDMVSLSAKEMAVQLPKVLMARLDRQ